jgi:hypothetical protein
MLAAAIVLTLPCASHAGARALLSIVDLPISSGQYVSGFQIHTTNVDVLAVCKIPDGWSITAASQGGPNGELDGQGVLGVAFVEGRNPAAFKGLFLIDTGRPAKGASAIGRMFDGSVTVGRYGADGKDATVALKPGAYRLTAATRCPTP